MTCDAMWILASAQSTIAPFIQIFPEPENAISRTPSKRTAGPDWAAPGERRDASRRGVYRACGGGRVDRQRTPRPCKKSILAQRFAPSGSRNPRGLLGFAAERAAVGAGVEG